MKHALSLHRLGLPHLSADDLKPRDFRSENLFLLGGALFLTVVTIGIYLYAAFA